MLFSLLICTGLRLGEAPRLKWTDIDWNRKPVMVSVIGAKFDKDREIPLADGIAKQLSEYQDEMCMRFLDCERLFPSRNYTPYSEHKVYVTFRRILWSAGISHGGAGKGSLIHDFRLSFAVKSLRKMIYSNEDIMAVMLLLSQYLGHKNIYATQNYLQFTADMFPYVTETVQTALGNIIPEMEEYDALPKDYKYSVCQERTSDCMLSDNRGNGKITKATVPILQYWQTGFMFSEFVV